MKQLNFKKRNKMKFEDWYTVFFVIAIFIGTFRLLNVWYAIAAIVLISPILCYSGYPIANYIFAKLKTNKNDGIYVRDVEVEYSPAVLSFLANYNIEPKKDFYANALLLVSKKYLSIKTGANGDYINDFEVAETNLPIEALSPDEKYVYDCIKGTKIFNADAFSNTVEEEYGKYEFSKAFNLPLWIFSIPAPFAFVAAIEMLVSYKKTNFVSIFPEKFQFFSVVVSVGYVIFTCLIQSEKMENIYTTKGETELLQWKRFANFLEDFSMINDKEIKDVILWEKYLAYAMALNINKSYKQL